MYSTLAEFKTYIWVSDNTQDAELTFYLNSAYELLNKLLGVDTFSEWVSTENVQFITEDKYLGNINIYLRNRPVLEIQEINWEEYDWEYIVQNERKVVFKDLDIKNFDWQTCPKGYSMGATGLLLSTLDMIKLPIMLLNNGVYNGKRILSKEWMKLLEDNEYENYNFNNSGWYLKGGMRNQMIMYNKEFDCAIAWHSLGLGYGEMRKFVVDNITSKLEY